MEALKTNSLKENILNNLKLDKMGKIILVITLIVSLTLIITGSVIVGLNNRVDNDLSNISYRYISEGSNYTPDCEIGEYIGLKFYSASSGKMYLTLYDCTLYIIEDGYGSTISTYTNNNIVKSFYAVSGETYYIILRVTGEDCAYSVSSTW